MAESTSPLCPRCGAPVEDGTAGLCPRCLLAMSLRTRTFPTGEPAGAAAGPPPSLEEMAAKFPQFEFLECLGRGGMGIVYKALQKALDRLVAIKILAGEWQHEPGFAERFSREARTLAKLAHPHIVTVHDFGEAAGLYYLVMEFIDGVNLRDLLREGCLEPQQALAIVPPVCEALQYAHRRGVVHRDIKPENLLLDREGRVKIADFGIAMLAGDASDASGTPAYMAPEQGRAGAEIDHRVDIYALGVVLYEMLTGHRPGQQSGLMAARVSVDVRIDEMVLRALAIQPQLRYQSAGEMATAVRTVAATLPAGVAAFQPAPPPPFLFPELQAGGGTVEKASPFPPSRLAQQGLLCLPVGGAAICLWLLTPAGAALFSVPGLLTAVLLFLGLMAPIASMVLGWMALRGIRRSPGSSGGLGLALVDALLLPLILLVWMSLLWWRDVIELLTSGSDPSGASAMRQIFQQSLSINREGIILAGSLVTDVLVVAWAGRKIWIWVKDLARRDASRPRLSPVAVGSFVCIAASLFSFWLSGMPEGEGPGLSAFFHVDAVLIDLTGPVAPGLFSEQAGFLLLAVVLGGIAASLGAVEIRRSRLRVEPQDGLGMAVLATAAYPVALELWLMASIWPPLVEMLAGRNHQWIATSLTLLTGGFMAGFFLQWLWRCGRPVRPGNTIGSGPGG